jgi:hypothetical protein
VFSTVVGPWSSLFEVADGGEQLADDYEPRAPRGMIAP